MTSKTIMRCFLCCIFAGLASPPAWAAQPVGVVVTLPDLGWVAQRIGGEHVTVRTLLSGKENPHYVDAVPRFIRWAAEAEVVCFAGLSLEIGWLPKVLSMSGNAKVQPGGAGHCDVGRFVEVLDKPLGHLDRSMGDIHPEGNPHFWLSPLRLAQGSRSISEALGRARPALAEVFEKNLRQLESDLSALLNEGRTRLASATPPGGAPVMEYHREFAYFAADHGLDLRGAIEEKPGVPPSAGRLVRVAEAAKADGVRLALAATYGPRMTLRRFEELSGISVLIVATSMTPAEGVNDYFSFQRDLVGRIEAALKPSLAE